MIYDDIARKTEYKKVLKDAGDALAYLSENCLHLRLYPKLSEKEIFLLSRKIADMEYYVNVLKSQFDIHRDVEILETEYAFEREKKIKNSENN